MSNKEEEPVKEPIEEPVKKPIEEPIEGPIEEPATINTKPKRFVEIDFLKGLAQS